MVPQKASVLADRLSQALSPLIACQEQCEQVHTYSVEAWYEEKSRLLEIFGQALKVKANLVVSTDLFGMVMYTPGTLFDENFMMTESMAFSGTRQPCHEPPQVALCLMPSLQLYEYDRRIVDYNSFSRMDTNPKEARCVFNKALVITENLDKPIAAVR